MIKQFGYLRKRLYSYMYNKIRLWSGQFKKSEAIHEGCNMATQKKQQHHDTFPRLEEFCGYLQAILGRAETTVSEYRYDIALFFRYYLQQQTNTDDAFADIDLRVVDDSILRDVTLTDIYGFISFLAVERKNGPAARSRRVSSIRTFFTYLTDKVKVLDVNVALQLEAPKQLKRQPRYLTLEQSQQLLETADLNDSQSAERDYLMLTLFLNTGLRLSELVGINISSIKDDTLVVLGKGGKERTIYLNNACMVALAAYLEVRPETKPGESDALFISRLKKRIGVRAVQNVIKKYIMASGLDPKRFSTHKLRHTAATLMYQHGEVDIRSLQTILGHASIATTEIYTHINAARLHEAVESNPLATVRPKAKAQEDSL